MIHEIEDLLFTVEICRKNLPGNTNPVHFERLWYIEKMLEARARTEKAREAERNG